MRLNKINWYLESPAVNILAASFRILGCFTILPVTKFSIVSRSWPPPVVKSRSERQKATEAKSLRDQVYAKAPAGFLALTTLHFADLRFHPIDKSIKCNPRTNPLATKGLTFCG